MYYTTGGKMRYCSKCLLPESLSGSHFNEHGQCFWCQTDFPQYKAKGEEKLRKLFENNKGRNGSADCLVGLSGGKDSTYTLYKIVREYGLKAEAFTYVHDGSTEFSINNAVNVCKELNVKHHIVKLSHQKHLKSFKDYFRAWLEKPNNISAGMTCVACKYLHILGSEIAQKRSIPNIVWSSSPLEYSPFLAIKVKSDKENPFKRDSILNSAFSLMKHSITSPRFIRALIRNFKVSCYGCLAVFPTSSFLKYKFPKLQSVMFYDYVDWNPRYIKREVMSKLPWEIPGNIEEDWHSDCVFNIFKEYMFQKMLGVSYTDAFLSNQIRHGIIDRETAIKELRASKKNFAAAIPQALKYLNMENYIEKIDFRCFEDHI